MRPPNPLQIDAIIIMGFTVTVFLFGFWLGTVWKTIQEGPAVVAPPKIHRTIYYTPSPKSIEDHLERQMEKVGDLP